MKTYLTIGCLVLISIIAGNKSYAQVGMIGNSPHKSAALDLNAPNKGLLIPRIGLASTTDKSQIINTAPAQTLMLYNTNANISGSGADSAGYYYWDTNLWKKLETAGGVATTAWSLAGNKGTNPGSNFLGTTDANALVVKTNNTESVRVTTAGNMGITTATPGYKLEVNGTSKVDGAFYLGMPATAPATGTAQLVRHNRTGQVYQVTSATGNTQPIAYVKYVLSNVSYARVSDCDTKVDTSDYIMVVVGSNFETVPAKSGMVMAAGYSGSFAPQNIYAFKSGTTWHLFADYVGGTTYYGGNGTWTIWCMLINKSIVNTLPTVTASLGGGITGNAAKPAGL
jgi:hypothetical protein